MARTNRTKRARQKPEIASRETPEVAATPAAPIPRLYFFLLPIVLAVTAAIYAPAIRGGWVYDDYPHIVNNKALQSATTLGGIMFCGWSETRPLFNLLNRAQIELTGMRPVPFHIANILFHLGCGVFAFLFLRELGEATRAPRERSVRVALLAAAIFLLHPLETESVANINGRSGVLMTLFYLASLWLFTRHIVTSRSSEANAARNASSYFYGALACGLVAQGFKESAITLIFAIAGVDFLAHDRRPLKDALLATASRVKYFLATTLVVPILLKTVKNPHALNIGMGAMDPWIHFITQWKVVAMFLGKFLLPIELTFDYDMALASTDDVMPLVGLVAILAATIYVLVGRAKYPLSVAGWIFFLAAISPTNSIVPNLDFVAERHMYLPLLGLAVIAAERIAALTKARLVVVASGVAIYFSAFTLARNFTWSSDEKILRDTIAKSPGKDRPYMGLAYQLLLEKRYDDAIALYNDCLAHTKESPLRVQLYTNLGEVYRVVGNRKAAIETFDKAIAMEPFVYPKTSIDKARALKAQLLNPLGPTNAPVTSDLPGVTIAPGQSIPPGMMPPSLPPGMRAPDQEPPRQ